MRTRERERAASLYRAFLDRLRGFRVLDPACGSGNFLNLALLALKDLEHRVSIEAEAMGLQREFSQIGPASVKGVESQFLCRRTRAGFASWIGDSPTVDAAEGVVSSRRDPILKPLETVECRDAILNPDGTEAKWPDADVVIGNPPFLGGKLLRTLLGDEYVASLFNTYRGRVPAEADLVTYWFAKAWGLISEGDLKRAGLVATNSIRGGANRRVLQPIASGGMIVDAWDDEPWVVDGAAVRVSIVCFGPAGSTSSAHLDGLPVQRINADLTGGATDPDQSQLCPCAKIVMLR